MNYTFHFFISVTRVGKTTLWLWLALLPESSAKVACCLGLNLVLPDNEGKTTVYKYVFMLTTVECESISRRRAFRDQCNFKVISYK